MLGFMGIEDGWVSLVYVLCILSTLLCVAYGIINWNRGEEVVEKEDKEWAEHEREVEEEL